MRRRVETPMMANGVRPDGSGWAPFADLPPTGGLCGRCALVAYRARAAAVGEVVTVLAADPGGVEFYIHPAEVVITRATVRAEPWRRDRYWRGWLTVVPHACTCGHGLR